MTFPHNLTRDCADWLHTLENTQSSPFKPCRRTLAEVIGKLQRPDCLTASFIVRKMLTETNMRKETK